MTYGMGEKREFKKDERLDIRFLAFGPIGQFLMGMQLPKELKPAS